MKPSFSTLGCPDWTLPQVVQLAAKNRIAGIELRFIENQDALWKLPVFSSAQLPSTKRLITDNDVVISCVDTSCRFHSPDPAERKASVEEGQRIADLAAALGAPGIRIFGDKIQKGADRQSTRNWIAESMWELAERTRPKHVEVWIETHGDFATSQETSNILKRAACHDIGAVWDPANCILEVGEKPAQGGPILGASIRHVHIKDLRDLKSEDPALPGDGVFPMRDVVTSLAHLHYDRFVSFEWEKKWHPDIPDANIAVPRFADWWAKNRVA
jgi:sugar phosphate isomerase/epimerase